MKYYRDLNDNQQTYFRNMVLPDCARTVMGFIPIPDLNKKNAFMRDFNDYLHKTFLHVNMPIPSEWEEELSKITSTS